MKRIAVVWMAGWLGLAALWGCPAVGDEKQAQPADQAQPAQPVEEPVAKPKDLGPPLVDDVKALTRLDKTQPIWIDKQQKQVVLQGETCKAQYLLEFFATLPDRGYEAVVTVRVKPSLVHAALLAVGAKPGSPVKFQPRYVPPSGTEVAIEVRWKDKQGKLQKAPAQQWIRNVKTKKAMDVNWVFAGSNIYTDEETGKKYYQGDSGDFITVLNLPTAVLDVPMQGASDLESRNFEGFAENMPPEGTPVTIVLMPKLQEKGKP
jgi:hypothetical protein